MLLFLDQNFLLEYLLDVGSEFLFHLKQIPSLQFENWDQLKEPELFLLPVQKCKLLINKYIKFKLIFTLTGLLSLSISRLINANNIPSAAVIIAKCVTELSSEEHISMTNWKQPGGTVTLDSTWLIN